MADLKPETNEPKGLSRRALVLGGLGGSFFLIASSVASWKKSSRRLMIRVSAPVMGTTAEIILPNTHPDIEQEARQALEVIGQIEQKMTRFRTDSEVGRINVHPGRFFRIGEDTARVVRAAMEVARASDGQFDPGMGNLESGWGFDGEMSAHRIPKASAFFPELLREGHYRKIEMRDDQGQSRVRLSDSRVSLDLGGIAKGDGVDQAVRYLRKRGIENAVVNIGGDLFAMGRHPSGRDWQIGIRHPRKEGEYLSVLSLRDQAVATSGDYERFRMVAGKRFHHLLNPRTGWPAPYHQSVTVVGNSAMMADALATAAFATPTDQSVRLLKRLAPAGWLAIGPSGQMLS